MNEQLNYFHMHNLFLTQNIDGVLSLFVFLSLIHIWPAFMTMHENFLQLVFLPIKSFCIIMWFFFVVVIFIFFSQFLLSCYWFPLGQMTYTCYSVFLESPCGRYKAYELWSQTDLDFCLFSSHLHNGDKTYLWLLKIREALARNVIFFLGVSALMRKTMQLI